MSYSQDEIEQKRLLALQRKKEAQIKTHLSSNSAKLQNNISSANIINNEKKLSNVTKPLGHGNFGRNSIKSNTKFKNQKERFNPIESKAFFGQKSRITGKCYMINDERFVVESSYFLPLIETFKKIPSKLYGNIYY